MEGGREKRGNKTDHGDMMRLPIDYLLLSVTAGTDVKHCGVLSRTPNHVAVFPLQLLGQNSAGVSATC